jgi:hypothetical protein
MSNVAKSPLAEIQIALLRKMGTEGITGAQLGQAGDVLAECCDLGLVDYRRDDEGYFFFLTTVGKRHLLATLFYGRSFAGDFSEVKTC